MPKPLSQLHISAWHEKKCGGPLTLPGKYPVCVHVLLTEGQAQAVFDLGEGNISAGIREAIRRTGLVVERVSMDEEGEGTV